MALISDKAFQVSTDAVECTVQALVAFGQNNLASRDTALTSVALYPEPSVKREKNGHGVCPRSSRKRCACM